MTEEIAAPGELIKVGGCQMHYVYKGDTAPTVVFEAGFGANHLTWALVQPEVEKFASVFSYDRAGLGWSDIKRTPRTPENIVSELNALLEKAEIPTPYIVVGHSRGGEYMRQFAHRFPDKVSGIVLVDSAHEQGYYLFPPEAQAGWKAAFERYVEKSKVWMNLPHDEAVAALKDEFPDGIFDAFPEHIQAMLWDRMRPHYFESRLHEFSLALDNMNAGKKGNDVPNLGDIPLTVLYADAAANPNYSDETNAEVSRVALAYQHEFAALSTNGRLQHVPDAGHRIQVDQPQTVIDAIQELVDGI